MEKTKVKKGWKRLTVRRFNFWFKTSGRAPCPGCYSFVNIVAASPRCTLPVGCPKSPVPALDGAGTAARRAASCKEPEFGPDSGVSLCILKGRC